MILALDLGARTGWATNDNGVVNHGVVDLTNENDPLPAWRFINLNSFLCDFDSPSHGYTRIDRIVYEMPHMRGFAATFSLMGLAATVESWAARHGVERPKRVHSATIKKHTAGSGKATKDEVMAAVSARIHKTIHDDNEADALALLLLTTDLEEKENEAE